MHFGCGLGFGSVLVELEVWLWCEEGGLRMDEVEEGIYGVSSFCFEILVL